MVKLGPSTLNNIKAQARDIVNKGTEIIKRETGSAPVFDLSALEQKTPTFNLPEKGNAVLDTANRIKSDVAGLTPPIQEQQNPEDQKLQQEIDVATDEKSALLGRLTAAFNENASFGQRTIELEDQNKIAEKTEAVTEIQNKIRETQRRQDLQTRNIESDQTLSIAQKNARLEQSWREQARELADLSIIEQSALANYETARALVDRKVELEMADSQARLDAFKFFYQENKEYLTKKEDQQFQRKLKKEERDFQIEFDKVKRLEDTKASVLMRAVENGASQQTLTNIQSSETVGGAIAAAGGSIVDQLRQLEIAIKSEQLGEIRTAKEAAELRKKALEEGVDAGIIELTDEEIKRAGPLIDDYEKESSNFKETANRYSKVIASAENPSAAGDVSLIFAYMKMLDPTSVVREGEQATASNAGSIPQRIVGQYNKALSGERFTDEIRADFVDRASKLYNTELDRQRQIDDQFKIRATQFRVPPEAVVRDLTLGVDIPAQSLSDDELLEANVSSPSNTTNKTNEDFFQEI